MMLEGRDWGDCEWRASDDAEKHQRGGERQVSSSGAWDRSYHNWPQDLGQQFADKMDGLRVRC